MIFPEVGGFSGSVTIDPETGKPTGVEVTTPETEVGGNGKTPKVTVPSVTIDPTDPEGTAKEIGAQLLI